jgi:hypothetical protein
MRLPFATWMPIQHNFTAGGMALIPRGLAVHITDGVKGQVPNLAGVQATFNVKGAGASAHFCVAKNGDIAQYVDLSDIAWGVGGDKMRNDDAHWISVENIALPGQELTKEQIRSNARLLAWFHTNWGLPLQLASTRDDIGLGYHSMFHRGHLGCPGPKVIAQRLDIIQLVTATAGVLEPGF